MSSGGEVGDSGLTLKQQRFVEAYAGDGQAAAVSAGYSPDSAKQTAYYLLREPRVVEAIEAREKKTSAPLIRSRVSRQEWLVRVIEDVGVETKDRLKAMEMLKRSCGDFLERVEVTNRYAAVVPEVDAETVRAWARRTLPAPQPQEEEEAEVVGPH
jgi:hypothetical protein